MNDSGVIYIMLLRLTIASIRWVIDQFCHKIFPAISLQDCRHLAEGSHFQKLPYDTHPTSQAPSSLATTR